MKTQYLFSLLVVLLLVSCTTPAPVETQTNTTSGNMTFVNVGYHEITISGYMFTPKAITVYQGDRVKWINKMPFIKSIWIWGQDPSPIIKQGYSWSYIFTEPGFYKYRDQYNQDMEGNVTVLPYEERPDVKAKQSETPLGP